MDAPASASLLLWRRTIIQSVQQRLLASIALRLVFRHRRLSCIYDRNIARAHWRPRKPYRHGSGENCGRRKTLAQGQRCAWFRACLTSPRYRRTMAAINGTSAPPGNDVVAGSDAMDMDEISV